MRERDLIPVQLEPQGAIGAVFGDGTHPTTRLAAAAVADVLVVRPGARVLDVGTGSGVLVRAALASGSCESVGIDHDRAAIDTARTLTDGGAFQLADARDYLTQVAGGAFDIVVANLPDPPLSALADELTAAARPGGTLIVTGMLLWQADGVAEALVAAGAHITSRRAEAGWALLVCDC